MELAIWLEKLASPVTAESAAGEDPRYDDAFVAIKMELEKNSQIDMSLIKDQAERLLLEKTRDWRVLMYAFLAWLAIEQNHGLHKGLTSCLALLKHQTDCYPRKETARTAALHWLDNPWFEQYLARIDKPTAEELERLSSLLEDLTNGFSEKLGVAPKWLAKLSKWIEKNRAEQAATGAKKAPTETKASKAEIPTSATGEQVFNSTEALNRICDEQWKNGDKIFAYQVMLARIWSEFQLPTARHNKTMVPPPRDAAKHMLASANPVQEAESTLNMCYMLLFESAATYWLDVQFLAYQSAKRLKLEKLCRLIQYRLMEHLEDYPNAAQLQFSDATAFASTKVQAWLRELLTTAKVDDQTSQSIASFESYKTATLKQVKADSLQGMIAEIERQPVQDVKNQFQQLRLIAELLLENGFVDDAEFIYSQLLALTEKYQLFKWHKDDCMPVLTAYYQNLKLRIKSANLLQSGQKQKDFEKLQQLLAKYQPSALLGLSV